MNQVKPTLMLLLMIMLLTAASLYLLNMYICRKTGIKDALFYYKCEQNTWIAETAWRDGFTGQVSKIMTTSHWQDGVISALSNGEKIYHTKQPSKTRQDLLRYHRLARRQFFYQVKWKALTAPKHNINIAYFKLSRYITSFLNQMQ